MPALIRCRSVSKRFGDVKAVDSVSLALHPGEIVAILGQSGCGKTTLLRLIAGYEELDSGEVEVGGHTVSSASEHAPPERRGIGMVFQEYALFPHMTVAQNVGFGLRGMSARDRRRRIWDALSLVELLGFEERFPHELSGGQQQRVALARTLAPSPLAVLLDEPFSNLDAGMRLAVRQDVVAILRAKSIAAVFVTHDVEEAFAIADRIGVMVEGRLVQTDAPDALYSAPCGIDVARLVGDCDFIDGVMRGGAVDTSIGMLRAECADGRIRDGGAALVMVRPQDLRIDADADSACVVAAHEFHGADTVLTAQMPCGGTVRCRQPGYSPLTTGARVRLTPSEGKVFRVFPAE